MQRYLLATTEPHVATALQLQIPLAYKPGAYHSQWESTSGYSFKEAQKIRDEFIKKNPELNVRVEYFNGE